MLASLDDGHDISFSVPSPGRARRSRARRASARAAARGRRTNSTTRRCPCVRILAPTLPQRGSFFEAPEVSVGVRTRPPPPNNLLSRCGLVSVRGPRARNRSRRSLRRHISPPLTACSRVLRARRRANTSGATRDRRATARSKRRRPRRASRGRRRGDRARSPTARRLEKCAS